MELRAFGHFRTSTPAWRAVPASDSPRRLHATPLSRALCGHGLRFDCARSSCLSFSHSFASAWSHQMAVTLLLLFFVFVATVWPASCALHSARPSTAIAVLKARDRVSTSSNPHSALITPPPQVQDQALFERDTDTVATCGFVSGNAGL